MARLLLRTNGDKINQCLMGAVDFFKHLESQTLADVNLEKALECFIGASMIYHNEWFELEIEL